MNQNIHKIRKYFAENKAERYPLENSLLKDKEEYTKSLYLRTLCMLVQYTHDPEEMQVLYLRRLIAGVQAENKLEDYMRMALEIETGDIDAFLSAFREDMLRYYFCLDGMILLAAEGDTEQDYGLLAEIVELLGVTKAELEYLTMAAKSILEQDSNIYDTAKTLLTDGTRDIDLYPYIKDFYVGAIIDTSTEKYIYSRDKSPVDLFQYGLFHTKKVVIENVTITLQSCVVFEGCEEVVIKNCNLVGNENNYTFNRVGKILITNCNINNFTNRFAIFKNTNNIQIFNNHFTNCGYAYSSDAFGGVLLNDGDAEHNIILENNELLNCYIESIGYGGGRSGIFLSDENYGKGDIKLNENRFIGCECRGGAPRRRTAAYIYVQNSYKKTWTSDNNICTGSITRLFADL